MRVISAIVMYLLLLMWKNNEIKEVSTLKNDGHVQGGCMVPVNLLASHNVKALIVGGIGMRPLMGFKQVGINVSVMMIKELRSGP